MITVLSVALLALLAINIGWMSLAEKQAAINRECLKMLRENDEVFQDFVRVATKKAEVTNGGG